MPVIERVFAPRSILILSALAFFFNLFFLEGTGVRTPLSFRTTEFSRITHEEDFRFGCEVSFLSS